MAKHGLETAAPLLEGRAVDHKGDTQKVAEAAVAAGLPSLPREAEEQAEMMPTEKSEGVDDEITTQQVWRAGNRTGNESETRWGDGKPAEEAAEDATRRAGGKGMVPGSSRQVLLMALSLFSPFHSSHVLDEKESECPSSLMRMPASLHDQHVAKATLCYLLYTSYQTAAGLRTILPSFILTADLNKAVFIRNQLFLLPVLPVPILLLLLLLPERAPTISQRGSDLLPLHSPPSNERLPSTNLRTEDLDLVGAMEVASLGNILSSRVADSGRAWEMLLRAWVKVRCGMERSVWSD